jgi:hypothetical protein
MASSGKLSRFCHTWRSESYTKFHVDRPELNRHGESDMHLPLPAKPTGGHGFETNAFVSPPSVFQRLSAICLICIASPCLRRNGDEPTWTATPSMTTTMRPRRTLSRMLHRCTCHPTITTHHHPCLVTVCHTRTRAFTVQGDPA